MKKEGDFHKEKVIAGEQKELVVKGEMINFDNLSEAQFLELRHSLEESKGRIIAFVHPYFPERESVWTDIGGANPADLAKMRGFLQKMSIVENKKVPPMLIFEEAEKIDALEHNLPTVFSKKVYIVPTEPCEPTPEKGGWEELRKKLKDLGAKEVIIAGMNLVVSFPDYADYPELAGCVADAAKEFSKDFKITVSQFVYPNTKDDYYKYSGSEGKK
jgi:hypothetical protein